MQILLLKAIMKDFIFLLMLIFINPLVSHGLDFTFIFLRDNFLNGARRSAISLILFNTFKMLVLGSTWAGKDSKLLLISSQYFSMLKFFKS